MMMNLLHDWMDVSLSMNKTIDPLFPPIIYKFGDFVWGVFKHEEKAEKMAQTSLAAQLKKLQTKGTSAKRSKNSSLLFDEKQASTIDTDTIYSIGLEGYHELLKIDENRFLGFDKSLFHRNTKDFERRLQTAAVNDQLDISILNFLRSLSPYFLLRPAHKALEYLLRKYR
jgi:U3 small nucleolar RNA-associated protein 10